MATVSAVAVSSRGREVQTLGRGAFKMKHIRGMSNYVTQNKA